MSHENSPTIKNIRNFEKEFPSLKNKHYVADVAYDDYATIFISDVMENCLDKQNVKEAWFKLRDILEKEHILTLKTYNACDNFEKAARLR